MMWTVLREKSLLIIVDKPPTRHMGGTIAYNMDFQRLPAVMNTAYNSVMDTRDNVMGSQATLESFEDILNEGEDPS